MSKLDRYLLSEILMANWKIMGQVVGLRDISYHSYICVKACEVDWGVKPFRFNNVWLEHKEFFGFVEKVWLSLDVKGKGDFFKGKS